MAVSRSKVTPTVVRVGYVKDDSEGLAAKIVQTLADGPRFVWLAEDNFVYSATADRMANVHESWIIGTFTLGHAACDIEEDLRVVANERSRNWIID